MKMVKRFSRNSDLTLSYAQDVDVVKWIGYDAIVVVVKEFRDMSAEMILVVVSILKKILNVTSVTEKVDGLNVLVIVIKTVNTSPLRRKRSDSRTIWH
jgi:hypothetical protein